MMDVARLNKQKSQLWWTVTILMIMCMYWLSNVVLWVPWSHNPQLGILLMLTVNPLFWAAGIYICLASENRTGNLMKKALVLCVLYHVSDEFQTLFLSHIFIIHYQLFYLSEIIQTNIHSLSYIK